MDEREMAAARRELVARLVASCADDVAVNRAEGRNLPDRAVSLAMLDRLLEMLFPGFRGGSAPSDVALPGYFDVRLAEVAHTLAEQITLAERYECRRRRCADCRDEEYARDAVAALLEALPGLRETLKRDVRAAFERDPSAAHLDAIVFCYPGVEAIATYRLAHELHVRGVPLLPRLWTERAHAATGIDINPGAVIGPGFFIDHGTGIVIGETTVIGENVAVYQGVTLGALAPAKGQTLRGTKRHPTIEDDVIIYAGATILGGETVVGRGAVIGGNVWITESVPPGTRIFVRNTGQVSLPPRV